MPSHQGDDRAPSAEVLVHLFRNLGEEADGALAAHARDEGVSATVVTTGERASGDRDLALTVGDQGDDRAPSAEILVHPLWEPGEEVDGALAAHARDEGVSAAAGTTGERAAGDRNEAPTLVIKATSARRAPKSCSPLRELGEGVDGALVAHAGDEGVSATVVTTGERASGDRDLALTVGVEATTRASAEILVHPLWEPGEEVDEALAAHPGDEGVSPAAVTTGERAAGDRDVALTVGDQGDDGAPSAESLVHPLREPGEEVDGALAAHARDEGVSAAAGTTGERAAGDRDLALTVGDQGDERAPSAETSFTPLGSRAREWTGRLPRTPATRGCPLPRGTTGERAAGDLDVALTVGDQSDEGAPSAEILVHPFGSRARRWTRRLRRTPATRGVRRRGNDG